MTTRRALLLLFAYVLLYYRAFFGASGVPVVSGFGDNIRQNYAIMSMMAETGDVGLWNPFLFSGHPLYANAQMGSLYPPAVLAAWFMGAEKGFAFLYFFHGVLALTGCFFLLNALGCKQVLAMAGALLYGHCILSSMPVFLQTHAFLPWVLLSAWHLVNASTPPWHAMGVGAIALAGICLGGHPQLLAYAMIGTVIILLVHCWQTRTLSWKSYLSRGGRLLCGSILGLTIAWFQLSPSIAMGAGSHRAKYGANSFALRNGTVDTILDSRTTDMPAQQAFRPAPPLTTAILMFLFVALVMGAERKSLQRIILWFVLGSLLYALGDLTPIGWLLNGMIPILGLFRGPEKVLLLLPLILVCGGMVALQQRHVSFGVSFKEFLSSTTYKRILVGGGIAALAALSCLIGWKALPFLHHPSAPSAFARVPDHYVQGLALVLRNLLDWLIYLAPFWLGALILLTCYTCTPYKKVAQGLLLCTCIASLFWAPVRVVKKSNIIVSNALIDVLHAASTPCRSVNMAISQTRFIEQHLAIMEHIDLADGIDPLIPVDYYDHWLTAFPKNENIYPSTSLPPLSHNPDDITNLDVFRKWNVRYILSGEPATRSDLREVAHFHNLKSYVFPIGLSSFPEVYVYEVTGWRERCWIANADSEKGTVSDIAQNRLSVTCRVDAREPLTLVNASSCPDEWQVTIDGQPAERVILDKIMPAVRVPEGAHQVRFQVVPKNLKRSNLMMSAIALLTALGLILVPRVRSRAT